MLRLGDDKNQGDATSQPTLAPPDEARATPQ
jgi:hypothetical protein